MMAKLHDYFNTVVCARYKLQQSSLGVKKTWCFIDCDYGGNIPVYIGSRISAAYPVQASSPNPTQYKAWVKQRFATILGMQLWSEDGIVKGCAPVLP